VNNQLDRTYNYNTHLNFYDNNNDELYEIILWCINNKSFNTIFIHHSEQLIFFFNTYVYNLYKVRDNIFSNDNNKFGINSKDILDKINKYIEDLKSNNDVLIGGQIIIPQNNDNTAPVELYLLQAIVSNIADCEEILSKLELIPNTHDNLTHLINGIGNNHIVLSGGGKDDIPFEVENSLLSSFKDDNDIDIPLPERPEKYDPNKHKKPKEDDINMEKKINIFNFHLRYPSWHSYLLLTIYKILHFNNKIKQVLSLIINDIKNNNYNKIFSIYYVEILIYYKSFIHFYEKYKILKVELNKYTQKLDIIKKIDSINLTTIVDNITTILNKIASNHYMDFYFNNKDLTYINYYNLPNIIEIHKTKYLYIDCNINHLKINFEDFDNFKIFPVNMAIQLDNVINDINIEKIPYDDLLPEEYRNLDIEIIEVIINWNKWINVKEDIYKYNIDKNTTWYITKSENNFKFWYKKVNDEWTEYILYNNLEEIYGGALPSIPGEGIIGLLSIGNNNIYLNEYNNELFNIKYIENTDFGNLENEIPRVIHSSLDEFNKNKLNLESASIMASFVNQSNQLKAFDYYLGKELNGLSNKIEKGIERGGHTRSL
jgi:hypothetical protein